MQCVPECTGAAIRAEGQTSYLVSPGGVPPGSSPVQSREADRRDGCRQTAHELPGGGDGSVPGNAEGEGRGGESQQRQNSRAGAQQPTTYHLHVFPREVLDFLLHPLDAVQQILILLVHPLVLLHKGLQLDLSLTGAFELRSERHRGQAAVRPSGLLTSQRRGPRRSDRAFLRPLLDGANTKRCPQAPGFPTVSHWGLQGPWVRWGGGSCCPTSEATDPLPGDLLASDLCRVPWSHFLHLWAHSRYLAPPGHLSSPGADAAESTTLFRQQVTPEPPSARLSAGGTEFTGAVFARWDAPSPSDGWGVLPLSSDQHQGGPLVPGCHAGG